MMEWNAKTPSLWDWDNPLLCGSGGGGSSYKLTGGGCSAGVGIGGGASSGSELGNACSSKSSVSASTDSSSMAGKAPSVLCFEAYRSGNKYTQGAGHAPPSGAQGESPIGLRLGKRTYFEDDATAAAAAAAAESNSKRALSPLAAAPEKAPAPAPALVKKSRVSHQSVHGVCCQVDGCNVDLSAAKDYHRKHRVCESHTKCPRVIVAGQERRFCQQCSRFHNLSEFDQKKRSCRKRLSDHNARRRKPQTDIISFDSAAAFSFSGYDDMQQINFLWNKSPTPMRLSESSAWENMYDFKLPQARGPWTTKTGGNNGQLPVPNRQLSNDFSSNCHEAERLLPLKGTTADVLSQGSKTSIGDSNLDGAPDLRRALSLLSAGSWVSSDPGEPSLIQLSGANTSTTRSFMHAANATSNHWQDGHSLDLQGRVVPFTMQNSGGQLQEFQQHKEPYETSYFDLRQMN